jgi:hypothetical protein
VFGAKSADVLRAVVAQATGIALPEDSVAAERQHNLLRVETDTKIKTMGKELGDKIEHRFDKLDKRIDELLLRGRR